VGVLAALAFAERMRRQRAICREHAASYAEREREARNFVLAYERHLAGCRARLQKLRKGAEDCKDPQSIEKFLSSLAYWEYMSAGQERSLREAKELLDQLSRLRVRWEQAGARPWLNLPPDPPLGRAD
jgi:hypothetical protein